MSDIKTIWVPQDIHGDWQMDGASLAAGGDLATAILISIFTDRLANADDDIPDGSTDRRGWWGDLGQDVPIGSRLWLLDRRKQDDETLRLAQDYIAEALQWLIDDGVVARFDISLAWTARSIMGGRIIAYKTDGAISSVAFASIWENPTGS